MSDNKPPAFQFYARDFLVGTMAMSLDETGAYAKLLAWSWDNGPLPTSEARRAAILGVPVRTFRKVWAGIGSKWAESPKGFTNTRLERQRTEQASFTRKQTDNGTQGARSKWKTDPASERKNKATRSQRLSDARKLGTHTEAEWAEMVNAFASACVRCGAIEKIVKDHIIPIYQGGSDHITNLQPLCEKCNRSKGPETIDHRIGRPQMRDEWLPERLAGGLAERLADVCQTSDSAICDLRTAEDQDQKPLYGAGAREDDPDCGLKPSSLTVLQVRGPRPLSMLDPGLEDFHKRNCPPFPALWGAAACRGGMCIPKYLWRQWELRGAQDTNWLVSLRLFVEGVMATTPPGAGDRAEDFWPKHFEAHFGRTAPVTDNTKTGRTLAAGRAVIAEQLAAWPGGRDGN